MTIDVLTPAVFDGIKRVKSVFSLMGERSEENPLGANMSVVDAVVREGLLLVGIPQDELDMAVAREIEKAHQRRAELIRSIGLNPLNVACPKPVHGNAMVIAHSATIANLRLDSPMRPNADSVIITEHGCGGLIGPADCPVIDLVDPNRGGQVAQCHSGWQGVLAGAIPTVLKQLMLRGTNPAHLLVNIHPNATLGFELQGEGLQQWTEAFAGEFVMNVEGRTFISMTDAVIAQLIEAGVRPDRIQTSAVYSTDGTDLNTLTDPRFYSHRARKEKGLTGRNAALLGLVDD